MGDIEQVNEGLNITTLKEVGTDALSIVIFMLILMLVISW